MLRLSKAPCPALALATLALATLTLATLAILVGCTSGDTAQARFVNAIPDDAQQLDIYFAGTKVFSDLGPFPSFSGSTYASVPAGSDMIAGYATGQTTNPVFSETSPVSFNAGSVYTVVATGFLSGSITFLAPVDNNTAPTDGNVAFRVIDASPSGPGNVDVWILPNGNNLGPGNTAPTISNLSSPSAPTTATSSYVTMPYNSNNQGYELFVAPHGSTTPLFTGETINAGSLTLGTIRTVVLVDNGKTISSTPIVLDDLN